MRGMRDMGVKASCFCVCRVVSFYCQFVFATSRSSLAHIAPLWTGGSLGRLMTWEWGERGRGAWVVQLTLALSSTTVRVYYRQAALGCLSALLLVLRVGSIQGGEGRCPAYTSTF